ncbi:MAG TPA: indole-3-glycerol-phosphate synthase TrpC [Actinospica sp.]|nr:indole-3-glycerol-phosphate synthase TrpC [Actinospica sp.]
MHKPVARQDRAATSPITAVARQALARVAARQAAVPLDEIRTRALDRPTPLNGKEALGSEHIVVVAELDPAHAAPGHLAEEYEAGGAGVIAVPVRPGANGVGSSLNAMNDANVHTQTPLLCLDPVLTSYQLWEARAHGASLVLLSAATLHDEALVSLVERSASIGLTPVVEVCTARDLVRALRADARTLFLRPPQYVADGSVQIQATLAKLLPLVPNGVVRVTECGSTPRRDLISSAKLDADAILVGRTHLAEGTPRQAVADLVAVGSHPALSRRREQAV